MLPNYGYYLDSSQARKAIEREKQLSIKGVCPVLSVPFTENGEVDYFNILPPTFFSPSAAQNDFHLESILRSVRIPVVIQHLPQGGVEAGADGLQPGCAVTDLYLWAERALVSGDPIEFEKRLMHFIPTIGKWIENLELLIACEKDILFQLKKYEKVGII